MTWRTALILVGSVWVLGWLGMSLLVFARTGSLGRQAGGADPVGSRKAKATIFIVGFFMFPFVCLRALGEFAPRLGVLLRLRPAWSVRAKGEDESHTWH